MKDEIYFKASKYGDTYLERNKDLEDRNTFVANVWINGKMVARLELSTKTGEATLNEV